MSVYVKMFLLLFILGYIVLVLGDPDSIVYPCVTPDMYPGVCISLFSCPSLMKSLGILEASAVQNAHQSICGAVPSRYLMVCCEKTEHSHSVINQQVESVNQPATINDKKAHRDFVIEKLLPTRAYCGLQLPDDRFDDEVETALDEFPWLAHAIFTDEEDTLEFVDRCNGALISNRYVLTTEYCARNPIKLRLGQYNTNKTISCISKSGSPAFTEPTIEIRIEEEIHREKQSPSLYHDFALFRLEKPIIYNNFIRPICLPLDDSTKPEERESFVFSGWGASTQAGVVKKRLKYSTTNPEECKAFRVEADEVATSENLICLTPNKQNTKAACNGDEGGPLMYSFEDQWFARGVIAKVYADSEGGCSTTRPADALKITPEIIEWILDNIHQ